MPLTFIALMSWAVFWIDPRNFGVQIGLASTSILTLVAFLFSLNNILPPLSYLTRMDVFLFVSLALAILAFGEAVMTAVLHAAERETLALRLDRWARWLSRARSQPSTRRCGYFDRERARSPLGVAGGGSGFPCAAANTKGASDMKESLAAKVLRGFFILLPFLIAYLMVGQLVDMLLALTQPLIDVMPGILIESEAWRRVVAFGVLLLICVLVALIADTSPARRFGTWFESAVMGKFPPYAVLKSLSARLSGKEEEQLQPALLKTSDDSRMLVAIVEKLPDGHLTVFVPMSPTPGIGVLQIVHPDKLELLQCSMSDALGWTLNWGTGTQDLLKGVRNDTPGHEI